MTKKYCISAILLLVMIFISFPAYAAETGDSSGEEAYSEEWKLSVYGYGSKLISKDDFEMMKKEHGATFTDHSGDVYSGISLTYLAGLVDDNNPLIFNESLAKEGYTFTVRATDWHDRQFSSKDVTKEGYLVADMKNKKPLPAQYGDIKIAPLLLIGSDVSDDMVIGNIMDITLQGTVISGISGQNSGEKSPPHIIILKYGEDSRTLINTTTTDCRWLKDNLPVYGDSKTHYKFQGPTFDTGDLWNPAEDKNPEKIDEVVLGTALSDICSLVGGMSPGDEIRLTAEDGYVVELMYENIYEPDPRQGTAILAWWSEKQGFAPEYTAAPALFFLADNHVFGNVDMRECLNPGYWRFYWCSGTEYPSAAGLAVRNVKTVEIYPATERDWDLTLDGHFVTKISRKEFEMGIACGARAHNHYSVYTDSEGHEWSGMPLYLLAGYVDDDCRHDENLVNNKAYNLTLAENNAYTVVVEGLTGDQAGFSSAEIIRDSGYLIANEMDGHKFDESGDYWPLALVGDNIPEEKRVYGVTKITLKPATGTEGVGSENYTDENSPVKESPFPVLGVIAGLLVSVLISRRI